MALNDGLISNIKDKWNLIIDEELTFYKNHEFNVSDVSKDIIERTIRVIDYDDKFYEVKPLSKRLWNDVIVGECKDTFLNHPEYVSLVKYAHSDHYTTLVPKENYDAFINQDVDILKRKFKKFYTISICNTNYFKTFKDTIILSSCFEKTISYRLLTWMGFNMKKMIVPNSREHHPNSHLITINYYCKSNWSNILKSKTLIDDNNLTLEDHIKDQIILDLNGKDFIYNANVNFRKKFKLGKLVTSTHGVNKYINHTNMVFMPSLNATASLVNVLSYFGITRKDIDFSRNVLHAYQFISRGAIRKANNGEPINIYVMDKRTVDFMRELYPKANVIFHNTERLIQTSSSRKRNPVPNNIRSFMSRVKSRMNNGEKIRVSTKQKYDSYMAKYY